MRLGLLAMEIAPPKGGMQEHARGLITHLAGKVQLSVFTAPDPELQAPDTEIIARLSGSALADTPLLRQRPVDAWLALSAGTAAYAPYLSQPLIAYVHGNDFTNPWAPAPGPWLTHAFGATRRLSSRLAEQVVVRWRRIAIRRGLQAAVGLFANSHYTRGRCIAEMGVRTKLFFVVAPGIDERYFQTPAARRAKGPLRLLTVSRLSSDARRKNIDGVIEAVALLKHRMPIVYTIVGDGDDLERLSGLATKLGVADRIVFAGAVDDARLRQLYLDSDAFVLAVRPAVKDIEGFGMVYVEAAASGVPSIAVRTGGVTDAVRDGETGILLSDASSGSIAAGVLRFTEERRRFDRFAIQQFARRHSAKQTTAHLLTHIKAMLGGEHENRRE
jgi:phosphatidylinositol alpha-1,6-mannosyltransferase